MSTELEEAAELLREAAWLHGLVDPPHPDWSTEEHEEEEEQWVLDRVFPWLLLHGYAKSPFGASRSSRQEDTK